MRYRLVKELERCAREGRILNKKWICGQLHTDLDMINKARRGQGVVQAYWIPLLKETLNADYHFIMWGFERPDISLPVKVVNGERIRLDVFPKTPLNYPNVAKWGQYIPERRPDDNDVRHEREYYQDLPTLQKQ
ncbi:hypothetical protein SAMN02745146_2743 [Hymenobacter daecheongensis DSM 21074]|uniref:Uncharacterized protein n=1 Tax=Hymenobacter daecheongensis DSM 21074 TaxID=1121955 RepID=A0A1M6I149_9BACT|nr:hypothetical protein [Hymenobacter daecheongensis]SHJ28130.1 hypothetical protein SAMN02745146_2743 [Hymenobacter daecheongensis DSM 21074]